jgi:pimeloyl-ACP methyl ester carboxylesterase
LVDEFVGDHVRRLQTVLDRLLLCREDPKFADDPRFGPSGELSGYVTTEPGTRIIWYYGWNADEAVFNLDEARLKDAMPSGDSGGFVDEVFIGPPRSLEIDVPVLAVFGDRDLSNCTPRRARRPTSFYPKSPHFRVEVRKKVAHALNLHRDARETIDLIRRWLDQHS